MNILKIDTTNNKETVISLVVNENEIIKKRELDIHKPQQSLPLINEILIENKLTLKDLDEIKVNTGPGSFTGIRVGVSIANALSFFLKIPVNGKKVGDFAEGSYT